jgi:hypothetical protein
MGQKGGACWVLVGKTDGKRVLATPEIDGIF